MVAVVVVTVVAVNALVWTAAIIDISAVVKVLIITVLVDVENIVVGILSVLSYAVDVSSEVAVVLIMDALVGAMLDFLSGIGIEVLSATV